MHWSEIGFAIFLWVAIAIGAIGFIGAWIRSVFLNKMLSDFTINVALFLAIICCFNMAVQVYTLFFQGR
jgi:hypothetical protein